MEYLTMPLKKNMTLKIKKSKKAHKILLWKGKIIFQKRKKALYKVWWQIYINMICTMQRKKGEMK